MDMASVINSVISRLDWFCENFILCVDREGGKRQSVNHFTSLDHSIKRSINQSNQLEPKKGNSKGSRGHFCVKNIDLAPEGQWVVDTKNIR